MTLVLRPHAEGRCDGRFHLDRFDAYLDGELILTSRQPRYDGARELLRRGCSGDRLVTIRHANQDHGSFLPHAIGDLAQWSISESAFSGLKRIRWQPMSEHVKRRMTVEGSLATAPSTREKEGFSGEAVMNKAWRSSS